jgi:GH15 family glucan-1,4-alpha-glucosidase
MDPPTGRPVTRSKNANQHPGRVVQVKKRRTKAEVESDRALLLAKTEAEKQKKNEGISRVAQLEDKMATDDANIGSTHPRSHKGIQLDMSLTIQR